MLKQLKDKTIYASRSQHKKNTFEIAYISDITIDSI